MPELKASESYVCSNFVLEPDKGNANGKHIDALTSAIISTTKTQKIEPEDPKEGERIFHS